MIEERGLCVKASCLSKVQRPCGGSWERGEAVAAGLHH